MKVGSVYQEKSGKWKASIQKAKVKHRLGTFATAEDAMEALNRKKCELGLEEEEEEEEEKEQRPRGVYRRKSGRYYTVITHPVTKAKIRLGTFGTAKEAKEAKDSKRREFDSLFLPEQSQKIRRLHCAEQDEEAYNSTMGEFGLMVKKEASCEAEATPVSTRAHSGAFTEDTKEANYRLSSRELGLKAEAEQSQKNQRLLGVFQRKSGRWQALVTHPVTKARIYLGTFDTTEEAQEAHESKMREFDSLFPGNKKRNQTKTDAEPSQKNQGPRHAYATKSGRWTTEIAHPITKARVRLGTFDTAEEAAEAYDSKRREFDLMFPNHKKRNQTKGRCAYPCCAEEAEQVLLFPGNKKLKQSNDSCRSDLACVSDDPSASSGGSMLNVNSESVPMFVTEGREFDSDVIDSYGQLVGEYSRLDDELWLCRPEDDTLQGVEGTNGEDEYNVSLKISKVEENYWALSDRQGRDVLC